MCAPRSCRPRLPYPLRPPPPAVVAPSSVSDTAKSSVLSLLRSTPRSRLRSPPGRPLLRGALSCCRRCSPVCGRVPIFHVTSPPLSSSSRQSSSTPFPPLHGATPFRPCSSLLLQRFSPLTPLGSCGRSSCPTLPFPRPRPPISPIGTKMLAIRRAGLWHAGRWQAGPCLTGSSLAVSSP